VPINDIENITVLLLNFYMALNSAHPTLVGINCNSLTIDCILAGHGNAVNEVKTHSVDDYLILSASKDERCICVCVCVSVYVCVCVCTCMYVYVSLSKCMCVYVYVSVGTCLCGCNIRSLMLCSAL
jgi:hypothetical protein